MSAQARRVFGIDPGLDGAIVGFTTDGDALVEGCAGKTPTFKSMKASGSRREYDVAGMRDALKGVKLGRSTVFIEHSQAMPRQGVSSTWKTGYGFGLWIGLLTALEIPFVVVTPQRWQAKAFVGVTGEGKERALIACSRLIPNLPLVMPGKRVADVGVADAALIAWWGARHGS